MHNDVSAHSIVAFAVVNLGIQMPIERFYEMSPTDPLYSALVKAYKDKEKRSDYRTALVCAVIANCLGAGDNKRFSVDDFMPREPKSEDQCVAELKAYMNQYKSLRQNGQIR